VVPFFSKGTLLDIFCPNFEPLATFAKLHPRPLPMHRLYLILTFCFALLWGAVPLFAQAQAVQDSLANRLALIAQLSQSSNYEQAQVEVEAYREALRRHKVAVSPKALGLMSGVYKANDDDRSAARLLTEAELDARRDPNPESKAALLTTLVKECGRWEMPELALACQQLLGVAQDSLAARKRRAESLKMQSQLDSLVALRKAEMAEQTQYIRIARDRAYMLLGAAGLVFLVLLFANFRNSDRWRKLLEKKELEWELLRSNAQQMAEETAAAQIAEATAHASEKAVAESRTAPDPYVFHVGPKPEQVALLIEPNRQVVLYLKSLLADRFQIETASTANEGLQMASNLLPDLVVCDALLNGQKTGIEVARQIKLAERTSHVPVVLLTDRYGNEGKLDALRAGAEAWFTRPVIDDEFDATVQRLLDARKVKHELFARFLHLYYSENRVSLDDRFLLQTVEAIDQNLADPDFTPEDIARRLQMSKNHYFKKLKVLTGKEPVQLVREMRLEKAKVLLEKRAGTPQAIAELVGFSSSGTFALAFKEYFGENTLLLNLPSVKRLG